MRIIVFRRLIDFGRARSLVLLFVVLLVLLFVSSALANYFTKSSLETFQKLVAAKDYQGLEKFTKQNGVNKTYDLVKKRFPNNDPSAHDFAHVVGIVAYQVDGMDGLSHCDTAYNYGCFHGFMESFVAQNGIEQIPQIESACFGLGDLHAPSCLHGIGHGVMIDSGYDLAKGLKGCHLLQNQSQIYCFDGVFMERIVQSMQAPEKRFLPTEATLDYPCGEVAYIYKSQCWRNQVTVWFSFFGGESRNAGQRCLRIEAEFVPMCLESVGLNIAMQAPKSADAVAGACAFIPENIVADSCVIGVVKELMFENKSPELAASLCNYVSVSSRDGCHLLFGQLKEDSKMRFGSPMQSVL